MSDQLRDRIAAAIASRYCTLDKNTPCVPCMVTSLDLADAVIAELGLKREGTDPDQIIGHGYPPLHRYVTEWESDDESFTQFTPAEVIGNTSLIATDLDVADAAIAALRLRRDRVGTLTRWVTEWIPDE